jgi:hypothetical protein
MISTQISNNGVAVSYGSSVSTTVNASGITLQGPGGGSVVISATDVVINQGHLIINQGSGPQYTIVTGPQIFDATYSSLAVQVQGTNIDGTGFDMASLISRGLVIYNAPNAGSAGTNQVIASLTRDPGNHSNSQLVLYKLVSNSHVLTTLLDATTGIRSDNGFSISGAIGKGTPAAHYTFAFRDSAGNPLQLWINGASVGLAQIQVIGGLVTGYE